MESNKLYLSLEKASFLSRNFNKSQLGNLPKLIGNKTYLKELSDEIDRNFLVEISYLNLSEFKSIEDLSFVIDRIFQTIYCEESEIFIESMNLDSKLIIQEFSNQELLDDIEIAVNSYKHTDLYISESEVKSLFLFLNYVRDKNNLVLSKIG